MSAKRAAYRWVAETIRRELGFDKALRKVEPELWAELERIADSMAVAGAVVDDMPEPKPSAKRNGAAK